ncbi:MAG: transcriptional regulator with XRE-family HTH domain [Thalassolituus oleivorans]
MNTMDKQKTKRLKTEGWAVGDASDFLELAPEEIEFIEFKIALANKVKELRTEKGLTQTEFARTVGSSQSRIAKLEAADSSVSTDLMLRSLFSLGGRRKDIPRGPARISASPSLRRDGRTSKESKPAVASAVAQVSPKRKARKK